MFDLGLGGQFIEGKMRARPRPAIATDGLCFSLSRDVKFSFFNLPGKLSFQ